jgi:hypothetical protein
MALKREKVLMVSENERTVIVNSERAFEKKEICQPQFQKKPNDAKQDFIAVMKKEIIEAGTRNEKKITEKFPQSSTLNLLYLRLKH